MRALHTDCFWLYGLYLHIYVHVALYVEKAKAVQLLIAPLLCHCWLLPWRCITLGPAANSTSSCYTQPDASLVVANVTALC